MNKNKIESKVKNKDNSKKPLFSYSSKQKDYFMSNLSLLISSGMGILPALKITNKEIKSKRFRKVIKKIIEKVEGGTPLWRAVDDSHLFSDYFVSLLKIGESSGRLEENLKIISHQRKKEKTFKSKIQSAVMYPSFVLVLAILVALGIAWFILPKLATVFSNLRMDLPAITKFLIDTGNFLALNGSWLIPLIIIFLFLIVFFLFIFPQTKFIGRNLLFYFPISGKIIQHIEVARFSFILGTLLKAGVPIMFAFDSLIQASTFPMYKKFFKSLQKDIKQGLNFEAAFSNYKKSSKLIPDSISQMIISSQSSGNLDEVLTKISEDMENKTETKVKNLSVLLEPALLVIVWLGVVAVALAVILPIYSLVGGINEKRTQVSTPKSPAVPVIEIDREESLKAENESNETTATSTEELSIPIEESEDTNTAVETKQLQEQFSQIEVLDNALGYLNVREEANLNSDLIDRVNPGETYVYVDTNNNWYQIILEDDRRGWVYGPYVEELSYE